MKNSSTKILIFVLFIFVVLSGYNYFQKPFLKLVENKQQQEAAVEPTPTPNLTQEKAAFEKMSTEQKIWQLISLPVTLTNGEDATESGQLDFIAEHEPGFVTIFGSDIDLETAKDFTQKLPVSAIGLAPLVAVDHEGGTVQRLAGEGFSTLPSWANICTKTAGEKIAAFEASARELRLAGVNIVFAPVVDVPRDDSFLKSRACQNQVASLDAAQNYIKAFGEQGILPVVKHYPGIGSVTKDLHFNKAEIYPGSQDTIPFEKVFSAFPNIGVMSAHVVIPDRTNGLPCSLSAVCLDPFPAHFPDVLIFTDALEMKAAVTEDENGKDVDLPVTAKMALEAGNNVLVFGNKVAESELNQVVEFLTQEYDNNQSFKDKVDASIYKVLDKKFFD